MYAPKLTKLSRKFFKETVLLIAACILLSATQAWSETVKGRTVFHNIKVDSIKVGDVPGHVLGMSKESGLVFFENGEVAIYSGSVTWDGIKGSSTFQGYNLLTFDDGSTYVIKKQGTLTAVQEGKSGLIKGSFSYVRGNGRFEGIQGSGSYTGKFFYSLGIGGGYGDFTGTYTLPKK